VQQQIKKCAKRKFMWVGCSALIVVAIALIWTIAGTHSVSISKEMIQAQVDKQIGKEFPVKGKAKVVITTVKLTGATVNLENSTLGANISIEGTVRFGKKFFLNASALGRPYYESGAFYFKPDQIKVVEFGYEGNTIASSIRNVADKYVSHEKTKNLIKDSSSKVEAWISDTATDAAMTALGKNPVYRLGDDMKSTIISSSLESIDIDGDKIILSFSLWSLTKSVLCGIGVLILAIAFIVFLLTHPEAGVVFEMLDVIEILTVL
jgi:hypothetical protein